MVSKLIFLLVMLFTLPAWGQTFTNGGCELAVVSPPTPDDWTISGDAAVILRTGTYKRSGSYGCVVQAGAGDSGLYQSVADLTIGNSYLVTTWVYGVDIDTGYFIVNFGNSGQSVAVSNGSWSRIQFSKIAEGTSLNLTIYVTPGNDTKFFAVDSMTIDSIPTGNFGGNMTGGLN